MNEKKLSRICFLITLLGLLMIIPFIGSFFINQPISQLISTEFNRGCVTGRIDYVMRTNPQTIFTLNDGTKTKVFYPKEIDIDEYDFVRVCGESQIYKGEMEIFAYMVIIE